jgi:putative salt-induced outer membrane protein YdiY
MKVEVGQGARRNLNKYQEDNVEKGELGDLNK